MRKSIDLAAAEALLSINAFGLKKGFPVKFKSGIFSPVYRDNRILPFHPKSWAVILDGFKKTIKRKKLKFDVIAGIETAGIPHSAALGFLLKKPSVFVRKEVKDHGTKKRIEGGDVNGKRVLLIEDMVSTGGSSLSGVQALRNEGAKVSDCLVIFSYEFLEAVKSFASAKVRLHPLTNCKTMITQGAATGKFSSAEIEIIQHWLRKPRAWREDQSV